VKGKPVAGSVTVAVAVAGVVSVALARRAMLGWGATTAERRAALPGDDLVPHASVRATRAITVAADAGDLWPWIAQLGQGRGGFYSYDVLENLIGCDIHSADQIVPAWQTVEVGDEVRLHPSVALAVAVVDPGHALVLRGAVPVAQSTAHQLRHEPSHVARYPGPRRATPLIAGSACWSRRATTTPACQPGARPPLGGSIDARSIPVRTISHETTELEFHMSPVASSSRPHAGVGT
jgi:hypothetical protein